MAFNFTRSVKIMFLQPFLVALLIECSQQTQCVSLRGL